MSTAIDREVLFVENKGRIIWLICKQSVSILNKSTEDDTLKVKI
jgi:hypothetical protein